MGMRRAAVSRSSSGHGRIMCIDWDGTKAGQRAHRARQREWLFVLWVKQKLLRHLATARLACCRGRLSICPPGFDCTCGAQVKSPRQLRWPMPYTLLTGAAVI